jgi:PKD repeat protein
MRLMSLLLLLGTVGAAAQTPAPVLYFSDLASGPSTGNTDSSGGRVPGRDGAIVTVWGRNLGSSLPDVRAWCGGAEAASYYVLSDATAPADLSRFHRMQMLSFQIAAGAHSGAGEITVVVGGQTSNSLPFTIRAGSIRFVKTTGDDAAGDGSWPSPWRTIPKAADSLSAGDIAYVCQGVDQTTETGLDAAVNLASNGEPGRPKALVVYPGAVSRVGARSLPRAFHTFNTETGGYVSHWVVSKFSMTTAEIGVTARTGFRVVGNFVTAPDGNGLDGAVGLLGNDVAVLGNELFDVGSPQCSKLYHAVYASGVRQDGAPRAPTEASREIGWNYIHDGRSNRAINVYSEQANSAFVTGHRIHDNVILNQRGDGILLGYYVTGENWITNNLIVRAGGGPDWIDDPSSHAGIRIDAGHEASPGTVIHVQHNTLHGCGYHEAAFEGENGHLFASAPALGRGVTLDFKNNIVSSEGEPLVATDSGAIPAGDYRNCWYGAGSPPAWDSLAIGSSPAFVDPGALNFQLQAASPCINAAAALSQPVARDLLGVSRPQGPIPDLGAYEFVSGGGVSCSLACSASAPAAGLVGEALAFSASVTPSGCPAGSPVVTWTFGDGAAASGIAATHSYVAAGTYSWSVTANLSGSTCTRTGTVVVSSAPAPAYSYMVPAVSHAPGAAGAVFRSDVSVVNRGGAAANLSLTFVPATGSPLSRTASVPAAGTRELLDVLVSVFGFAQSDTPFGALQIASDLPLVVSSRTYNLTASGTLGGFLPGVSTSGGLAAGKVGILPQLRRSAAFRTNVAVANLGAVPATVRVQLRDGQGAALGSARLLTAPAFGMIQDNDIFVKSGAGDQALAYATVEVETAGARVTAFASLIDNTTNDPTLIPIVIPGE